MREIYLVAQSSFIIGIISFLLACGGGKDQTNSLDEPSISPIQLVFEVINAPKPVLSDGVWVMVYELVISNQGEQAVTLESINVSEYGTPLLTAQSGVIGDITLDSSRQILPGEFNALFLWVESSTTERPASLDHQIRVSDSQNPSTDLSYVLPLNSQIAVSLGSPLEGDQWQPLNLNNQSDHRRALGLFDDIPRFAQRYAIDWVKVDEQSQWFNGDATINENYYAHGQNVYAVQDGLIAEVVNGYPDNTPGDLGDGSAPLAGNYLLLTMDNGESALYGHLLADSILVLEGSRVSKGDLLARVGNSGNSSAPHLHFHVAEVIDPQSPSTLNGIGQPFSFESFNVEAGTNFIGQRIDEMPKDASLISFLEATEFNQ